MEKRIGVWVVLFLFGLCYFVSGNSGFSEIDFTNNGLACNSSNYLAYWANLTAEGDFNIIKYVFNSSGSIGNCSLFYGELGIACCPLNYECNLLTGECEESSAGRYCEKYTTQESCEGAGRADGESYFLNEYPLEYESLCEAEGDTYKKNDMLCVNRSKCGCEWDGSSCNSYSGNYSACGNETDLIVESLGNCSYKVSGREDRCSDLNKIIVSYSVTANPPNYSCSAPLTKEYPCSKMVVVPFFTFQNFLMAFLVVGVVYFFIRKK